MKPEDIKKLRAKLGLSQTNFGKLLGVHWGTVNRWENGKYSLSPLAQKALQELLESHPKLRN